MKIENFLQFSKFSVFGSWISVFKLNCSVSGDVPDIVASNTTYTLVKNETIKNSNFDIQSLQTFTFFVGRTQRIMIHIKIGKSKIHCRKYIIQINVLYSHQVSPLKQIKKVFLRSIWIDRWNIQTGFVFWRRCG